jgi:hypothetical protein
MAPRRGDERADQPGSGAEVTAHDIEAAEMWRELTVERPP